MLRRLSFSNVSFHDADEIGGYHRKPGPPAWDSGSGSSPAKFCLREDPPLPWLVPRPNAPSNWDIIHEKRLSNQPKEGDRTITLELWPISRVASEFAKDGVLSHVWGSDLGVTQIEWVELLVRQDDPTKLELLREIIKTGSKGSRIWVDLLDINQKNDTVKLSQMAKLPHLYKSKKHTIVYHSESPESFPMNCLQKVNDSRAIGREEWVIPENILIQLLKQSEYSSRVWTLQELMLANKIVHVFRTSDPTKVLVTRDPVRLEPQTLTSQRKATKLHDYINGRAAIYDLKPIPYDASVKDVITLLFGQTFITLMHLYGDFEMNCMRTRAIFPNDLQTVEKFLLRSFQKRSVRSVPYKNGNGGDSNLPLCDITLPGLSPECTFFETEYGLAFRVNTRARIIRVDSDLLENHISYLGTAVVDWWQFERQERRVFVKNLDGKSRLCGFAGDGSTIVSFSWSRSPFVVPYVAVVDTTIYLIKHIGESEVVLGPPAGNYYGFRTLADGETKKDFFERDIIIYFEE